MKGLENKIVEFFKKTYYKFACDFERYDCGQEKPCYAPKGYVKCPIHGGKPTGEKMLYEEFYKFLFDKE